MSKCKCKCVCLCLRVCCRLLAHPRSNHVQSPLIKATVLYSLPITPGDSMGTTALPTVCYYGLDFGAWWTKSVTTQRQTTASLPRAKLWKNTLSGLNVLITLCAEHINHQKQWCTKLQMVAADTKDNTLVMLYIFVLFFYNSNAQTQSDVPSRLSPFCFVFFRILMSLILSFYFHYLPSPFFFFFIPFGF